MRGCSSPPMDKSVFRRLWTSLPPGQLDRGFWVALEAFCEPFFDPDAPFLSQTFFSCPHTGRVLQDELPLVDQGIVGACNLLRPLYDSFTLWNPLALAALFKVPIEVVTAQLLLGVQQSWISLHFVVCCRSCGSDIAHFPSVNDVSFVGNFQVTNAFRCPMCTDRTEVNELCDITVFFQLRRLSAVYTRRHHRLYFTEEADRRRLETFFCPAQAGFVFKADLPKGRYLLSAPFAGSFVELDVELSAEVMDSKDPYLPRIVDLRSFVRSQNSDADPFGQPIRRRSTTAHLPTRRGLHAPSIVGLEHLGAMRGGRASLTTTSDTTPGGDLMKTFSLFGDEDMDDIPPIPIVKLKHGKVKFRIYNDTANSGFLDLFVAFDTRTEFSANPYPNLFLLPHFVHCLPRGMSSPFFTRCIPRAPSTTRTTGAYVRHLFLLNSDQADDPDIISVLREVHRYSLEDHCGLLIGVGEGGATFDCSFLSTTAALASSICFFQRVLTRLGEPVALAMRCSVTEGPLKIAAYQGQYNDADNTKSSYPDAQVVGSVVYASNHPPITGHYFFCTEEEAPTVAEDVDMVDSLGIHVKRRKAGPLDKYRTPRWLHDENSSYYDIRSTGNGLGTQNGVFSHEATRDRICLVRFEIRSVAPMKDVDSLIFSQRSALTARRVLKEDGSDSADPVFPHFLNFLREHFEGTSVKVEAHALVVQMPLPMIYAALNMSSLLDKKAYSKELVGVF